jgi:hypothetical protein
MHVVEIAATDVGLRGAIAQCPLVEGLAGTKNVPLARSVRSTSSVRWSDAHPSTSPRAHITESPPDFLMALEE